MKQRLTYIVIVIILAAIVMFITLNVLPKQQRVNKDPEPSPTDEVEVLSEESETIDGEDRGGTDIYRQSNYYGSQGEIPDYIREVFGDSASWGLGVAWCESRFVPGVTSVSGKYVGLYQFDVPTWDNNCDGDITDWRSQTRCAKKLYDKGETGRWPNCP